VEQGWALLQMELCGGLLGIPGITQAEPVQTLESVIRSYIQDESGGQGQRQRATLQRARRGGTRILVGAEGEAVRCAVSGPRAV
jgi:hypothetical protein